MVSRFPESNMEGTTPSGNDLDQLFKHIQSGSILLPMTNVRYLVVFTKKQAEPKARTRRMPRYVHFVPSMGLILEKKRIYTRTPCISNTCQALSDLSNPSFGNSIYPPTTGHVVLLYIIIHNSSPLVLQIYWFTSLGMSFKYHTISYTLYISKNTKPPPPQIPIFFHPISASTQKAFSNSALRCSALSLSRCSSSSRRCSVTVAVVCLRWLHVIFGETFTKIEASMWNSMGFQG